MSGAGPNLNLSELVQSAVIDALRSDDGRDAIIDAFRDEEGRKVLVEAMAVKLEMTAGWNCGDKEERAEIRKDQEFLRDLRLTTRSGVKRVLGLAFAVAAAGFLTLLGVKSQFIK